MKFIDTLKWIGVLPVAVVSWVVVFWIVNLLYRVLEPVEISQWAITLMSSGGSGFAFVFSGSLLAPKGKKIVSVVLATIMGVFALISLFFAFNGYGENPILISVISAVSTIAGCVLACIQTHEEDK